jgi:hypothetical protein
MLAQDNAAIGKNQGALDCCLKRLTALFTNVFFHLADV